MDDDYDLESAILRAEERMINSYEIRLDEEQEDDDSDEAYDEWVDNQLSMGEDV